MSVVAMVVLSRGGDSPLDTNCGYFTRALSSSDRWRGVVGLFVAALSSRAPRFALRSLGRKRLENASVLQAASAQKTLSLSCS